MEIAFSGSREGMTRLQNSAFMARMYDLAGGVNNLANIQSFRHGVSGESDKIAHYTARALSFWIIGHPCDIEKYRFDCICDEWRDMEKPLVRNQIMINDIGTPKPEAGLLLATPKFDIKPRGRLGGTWATIMYAYKAGVPFEIIQRNGEIRYDI